MIALVAPAFARAQAPPAVATEAGPVRPVVRPAPGTPGEGFDVSGEADYPDGVVLTVQVERFLDGPEGEPYAVIPVRYLCRVTDHRFQERLGIPGTPMPGCFRFTFELDMQSLPPDQQLRAARRRPAAPVTLNRATGRGEEWAAWLQSERDRLATALEDARRFFAEVAAYAQGRVPDEKREQELNETSERLYNALLPRAQETDTPTSAVDVALSEAILKIREGIPPRLFDEEGKEEPVEADGKTVTGAALFDLTEVRAALKEAPALLDAAGKATDDALRRQLGLAALALCWRVREAADASAKISVSDLTQDAEAVVRAAAGPPLKPLRDWCGKFQAALAAWGVGIPPDAAVQIEPLERDLAAVRASLKP